VAGAITGGLVAGAGALLKGVGSKVLSSVEEDTASHLNLEGTICSFTPQTVVASEHGEQPIGKVHVGERVLASSVDAHWRPPFGAPCILYIRGKPSLACPLTSGLLTANQCTRPAPLASNSRRL